MRTWIVLAMVLAASLSGCFEGAQQLRPQAPAAPQNGDAAYLRSTAVKNEGGEGSEVERALAWSEKYSQAVEKTARLQQDNRDLELRNQKLQEQSARQQAELAQAQKELVEANTLLLEMRGDLEKWKGNVLGFREEIRRAQQAQLEAMGRVLKLLGGEAPVAATQPVDKEIAKRDDKSHP